ncbi:uncharacterized protein LOC118437435 [Folsomia candida]|uniref:uncharacterized protein LOC118437435 n=1 Tax=Folsomia candida TaxID=158441 RepID=UPI00160510DA|nr:uncharacterized protein LOC118437435 [Folsomia candida]
MDELKELLKFEATLSSLLGALSSDTFDHIFNVFNLLVVDVEENKIRIVVAVIQEKIVRHPEARDLYAKLISTAKSTMPTLVKQFLDSWQAKFLRNVNLAKIIGLAPDLREPLKIHLNAVKTNCRNYGVALAQFVGELYNEKVMGPAVIINCVEILLDLTDDINIATLCALLRIAGPKLNDKAKKCKESAVLLTDVNEVTYRDAFLADLDKIHKRLGLLQRSDKLSLKSQCAISEILTLLRGNPSPTGDNLDNQVAHIAPETATETIQTEKVNLPVKTRQILNKLKAANITGIVHEFASLLFEGEADMKIVVDIMLDKIGLKPSLATRYANLIHLFCSQESKASLPFKKLIQTCCKERFLLHNAKFTLISKPPFDPNSTLESFQEHESLSRKQFRGLAKFMGELFNFNNIPCNVVMQCVKKLLVEKDDANLECLSILVTTAGKGLQEQTGTEKMFKKIQDLVDGINFAVSPQSQILLKGALSVRKNLKPVTIPEVSSSGVGSLLGQYIAPTWGRSLDISATSGNKTQMGNGDNAIFRPCFGRGMQPQPLFPPNWISKPNLIDSSEIGRSWLPSGIPQNPSSVVPTYGGNPSTRIVPQLADTRSSSCSSGQVKTLPKPADITPLSSQGQNEMGRTTSNSSILSSTTSQIISTQTVPQVVVSPSCQIHQLKYLSMYTNYDRMLSQLPSDIVVDINMELCSIIYQRWKNYKEELGNVVGNGSEFETGMFTRN